MTLTFNTDGLTYTDDDWILRESGEKVRDDRDRPGRAGRRGGALQRRVVSQQLNIISGEARWRLSGVCLV